MPIFDNVSYNFTRQTDSPLFMRVCKVNAGGNIFDSETLTIRFDVPFDDDEEPNESKVELYNLSKGTISSLQKNQIVTIDAGYKNNHSTILKGRIDRVSTKFNHLDKITTLRILDTFTLDKNQCKDLSFCGNVSTTTLINGLAGELSLPVCICKPVQVKSYPNGYNCSGNFYTKLQEVVEESNSSMYINDGRLFVRPFNDGDDIMLNLNSNTGLIDTPEEFWETVEKQEIQGYKVKTLLQHTLTTRSKVRVNSRTANGRFLVKRGHHYWSGEQFYTEFDCIAI